MGTRCADHVTPLYPQKLAPTSPTGGGRSVGLVRVRTKATEFSLYMSLVVMFCYSCRSATKLPTGINMTVYWDKWFVCGLCFIYFAFTVSYKFAGLNSIYILCDTPVIGVVTSFVGKIKVNKNVFGGFCVQIQRLKLPGGANLSRVHVVFRAHVMVY